MLNFFVRYSHLGTLIQMAQDFILFSAKLLKINCMATYFFIKMLKFDLIVNKND